MYKKWSIRIPNFSHQYDWGDNAKQSPIRPQSYAKNLILPKLFLIVHKNRPYTLPIEAKKDMCEVECFLAELKERERDKSCLFSFIDMNVPQYIVFILRYLRRICAVYCRQPTAKYKKFTQGRCITLSTATENKEWNRVFAAETQSRKATAQQVWVAPTDCRTSMETKSIIVYGTTKNANTQPSGH